MGFVSLKHCEKTRKWWKHTGKRIPGFGLLWLLWKRLKALGREWPGFHWACIMERSLFYSSCYFLRIKCHSAAHTSGPKTRVCCNHRWLQKPCQAPADRLRDLSLSPHFQVTGNCCCGPYLETTRVIPRITLLGADPWGIPPWIFIISEYLTARDGELPGDPASWQEAIPSMLVEPQPSVR